MTTAFAQRSPVPSDSSNSLNLLSSVVNNTSPQQRKFQDERKEQQQGTTATAAPVIISPITYSNLSSTPSTLLFPTRRSSGRLPPTILPTSLGTSPISTSSVLNGTQLTSNEWSDALSSARGHGAIDMLKRQTSGGSYSTVSTHASPQSANTKGTLSNSSSHPSLAKTEHSNSLAATSHSQSLSAQKAAAAATSSPMGKPPPFKAPPIKLPQDMTSVKDEAHASSKAVAGSMAPPPSMLGLRSSSLQLSPFGTPLPELNTPRMPSEGGAATHHKLQSHAPQQATASAMDFGSAVPAASSSSTSNSAAPLLPPDALHGSTSGASLTMLGGLNTPTSTLPRLESSIFLTAKPELANTTNSTAATHTASHSSSSVLPPRISLPMASPPNSLDDRSLSQQFTAAMATTMPLGNLQPHTPTAPATLGRPHSATPALHHPLATPTLAQTPSVGSNSSTIKPSFPFLQPRQPSLDLMQRQPSFGLATGLSSSLLSGTSLDSNDLHSSYKNNTSSNNMPTPMTPFSMADLHSSSDALMAGDASAESSASNSGTTQGLYPLANMTRQVSLKRNRSFPWQQNQPNTPFSYQQVNMGQQNRNVPFGMQHLQSLSNPSSPNTHSAAKRMYMQQNGNNSAVTQSQPASPNDAQNGNSAYSNSAMQDIDPASDSPANPHRQLSHAAALAHADPTQRRALMAAGLSELAAATRLAANHDRRSSKSGSATKNITPEAQLLQDLQMLQPHQQPDANGNYMSAPNSPNMTLAAAALQRARVENIGSLHHPSSRSHSPAELALQANVLSSSHQYSPSNHAANNGGLHIHSGTTASGGSQYSHHHSNTSSPAISSATVESSRASSPLHSPKQRLRNRAKRQVQQDLGLPPATAPRRSRKAADDDDEQEDDDDEDNDIMGDGTGPLYNCSQCSRQFDNLARMQQHERVHSGEKPFECDQCGQRFNHRGSLTRHMRAHAGSKPHACNLCGKSFHQPGNLTVHMRTHTGEKPFNCTVCNKRFNHRSSLTVHQRNHQHAE